MHPPHLGKDLLEALADFLLLLRCGVFLDKLEDPAAFQFLALVLVLVILVVGAQFHGFDEFIE